MRRLLIIPGLTLLGLIAPAMASAHTAAIKILCPASGSQAASVAFTWQSFPKGHNVVDAFVTQDTITVRGGKFGFDGSSRQLTVPVTVPADGQPHTIAAQTTWYADGGGHQEATQVCVVPMPPSPTPPTPVPPTPVPPSPTPPTPEQTCHLGTVCCPVCVTARHRTLLAGNVRISGRTESTTRYARLRSGTFSYIAPRPEVMAANLARYGVAFDPVGRRITVPLKRNAQGRLYVKVDQAGLLAVRGQYFNGTFHVITTGGVHKDERRNWRLCMINDGDLDVPNNRLRD